MKYKQAINFIFQFALATFLSYSESIKFQFSGEAGESFAVKVALGDFSLTEEFLI